MLTCCSSVMIKRAKLIASDSVVTPNKLSCAIHALKYVSRPVSFVELVAFSIAFLTFVRHLELPFPLQYTDKLSLLFDPEV